MKTIRRKMPARTEVSYQCETCKSQYSTAKKAFACEKRTLEKKRFEKGQEVVIIGLRACSVGNPSYRAHGVVNRVVGPVLPDMDYEIRQMGGNLQRMNSHVWEYIVCWDCPYCKEEQRLKFYAPELVKFKK